MNWYRLEGHEPVEVSQDEGMRWMEEKVSSPEAFEDRRVGYDIVDCPDGRRYEVSTVFLGFDHGFGGAVQLFETMIFDVRSEHQGDAEAGRDGLVETRGDSRGMWRYATWDEAAAGHQWVLDQIAAGTPPLDPPIDWGE